MIKKFIKYFIYRIFRIGLPEHHLELELKRLATSETAKYIIENMPTVTGVKDRLDVHRKSLKMESPLIIRWFLLNS